MKKKVTKSLVALMLAVVCVFALAACGGSGSSAAGEYKLTKFKQNDTEMDIATLLGVLGVSGDVVCNLEEDGNFSLDMTLLGEESISGTWKADGSNVELTAEGETVTGTLSGNALTLSEDDMTLTFEK